MITRYVTDEGRSATRIFADEFFDQLVEQVAAVVLEQLPKPEPPSPYMTTAEAATFLRAKPQRVHDLLSVGKLTRLKDGGRTLVLRSEVEELVRVERARR